MSPLKTTFSLYVRPGARFAMTWCKGATLALAFVGYGALGAEALDSHEMGGVPSERAERASAVLSDGTVLIAYATRRSSLDPTRPTLTEAGVYLQRLDRGGAQILPTSQLIAIGDTDPRRPTRIEAVQITLLAEGGYVVGWVVSTASATQGFRRGLYTQRFDGNNRRVGVVEGPGALLASPR